MIAKERLRKLSEIREIAHTIIAERQCFSIKDLAVNGRDIMAAGCSEGPMVGQVLNHLASRVIDGDIPNNREVLLTEVLQFLSKYS